MQSNFSPEGKNQFWSTSFTFPTTLENIFIQKGANKGDVLKVLLQYFQSKKNDTLFQGQIYFSFNTWKLM